MDQLLNTYKLINEDDLIQRVSVGYLIFQRLKKDNQDKDTLERVFSIIKHFDFID